MATFDDLLEEAGAFGRCQKRIFALLCLLSLSFAGVYVGIVFQGFTPDHWCRDAALAERRGACGWSLADSRRLAAPLVNVSGELQRSSCERYAVDWNAMAPTCEAEELHLSEAPLTPCKVRLTPQTALCPQFDLVCSDGWMLDMYQSTLNLGFLLGSFACGYFADRKITFLVSNVINIVSGFLMAVVPDYTSILVFRALLGFSLKGGWMASYVLLTEMVGVKYRRTVGILYQMFFSIGNLILPLLAYFITDWRWLQVTITAPFVLFLSYYWWVQLIPESPRWLLSKNRLSEALQITDAMAKENRKRISTKLQVTEASSSSASLLDLVRTPNMRKHTFILMFNWFTSAVVYQGLIMRVGIAGGNVYMDFFISGLVEFPAAFLIIFTIERVGRRLPFASSNIVAGVSCIITMVVFVNTELYPTFVRNLAVSVCSTLCDVGGIVSSFILYRLAVIWLELPLIIFVVALVAGGLVLLLPETRGVPLPETIDDIEFPQRSAADRTFIQNLLFINVKFLH
uniref:Solute carrier family 22 member 2 n=1 Tax=Oryzias melastigma TaxID=30732 RepID=A0A3B3DUV8_ORYME